MNMLNSDTSRVDGSVTVVERGEFSVSGNHFQIPIGDGLSIQTGLLHEVCFTEESKLSRDLSLLLSAVKCIDRSVRRLHGRGWERNLRLEIPVYELATWRQATVRDSLADVLQYLTGDFWQVQFVKRRKKPVFVGQAPLLSPPSRQRVFVPFSNGLDSYAQSELLKEAEPRVEIMPVHLRASTRERTMKSIGMAAKHRLTAIPVAASVAEPKHAEDTYRTRPFLFDSLAALAAILFKGGNVLIPENGQGSLGGSLVRLGSEAPHRSCHPGFTTRLSRFLKQLSGNSVEFVHPALFHTKGQVLANLVKAQPNSDQWLRDHPSCSYGARHSNRNSEQIHCGVCGNCLLRRMSLHAADIADPTPYKISDLHANSIEDALEPNDNLPYARAYEDVARNAARSMQRLADTAFTAASYRVEAEVDSLARYQRQPRTQVQAALEDMLKQHRHEWNRFLDFSGRNSWVAKRARG